MLSGIWVISFWDAIYLRVCCHAPSLLIFWFCHSTLRFSQARGDACLSLVEEECLKSRSVEELDSWKLMDYNRKSSQRKMIIDNKSK